MRRFIALSVVALVGLLLSAEWARAEDKGSVILAQGFSAPNTYGGSMPGLFNSWCADSEDGLGCTPTVQIPLFDLVKAEPIGVMYTWAKDFKSANGSFRFKEFILCDLKGGQIYTLSHDGGHPGGAFADPTIIVPKQGIVVVLGGAEGEVIGGTGKYVGASGGYSSRLKVESNGTAFIYYDEMFFRFRDVKVVK